MSCRVFEFFVAMADQHGFALEDLVEGAGVPLEVLRDRSRRVPWATWAHLTNRFEELVGGPAATVGAGELIPELGFAGPVQQLASALVRPAQLYEAVFRWLGPYYFRNLAWEGRFERGDRMELAVRVAPDDAGSAAWMRLAEGAFRALPRVLGQESAAVSARITSHSGAFDVWAPGTEGLGARVRKRVTAALSVTHVLDELAGMQEDLRAAYVGLAATERELRAVLEALPDPVALVQGAGLAFANRAWGLAFGPASPEAGLPEELAASLEAVLAPRPGPLELRLEDAHGVARVVEVPPAATVRFAGAPARLLLLRDVTAIRGEAERRVMADRLAALGTIAASVGHEINNPLTYAMGSLELVVEALDGGRAPDPATLRARLEAALDGLVRVGDISRDLQTFARPAGPVEPVDLGAIVDAALRLTGNALRHVADVRRELTPDLPRVVGREGQLAQVFVNLLVNASQAMQEAGGPGHVLTVRTRASEGQVMAEVEDTGPGVPDTLRERVFEPFFTTKAGHGTGLGLAVCRHIVVEHGGTLEVGAGTAGGARFRVTLPAVRARGQVPRVRTASTGPPAGLRVLVVDDEPTVRRLVALMLRGHEVTTAADADEAEKLLEGDAAWDVVLCDVMMPGRTGPELHAALAARDPALAVRFVFVTGGAFEDRSRAMLERLDNPRLAKPFTLEELREVVAEVERRYRRSPRA